MDRNTISPSRTFPLRMKRMLLCGMFVLLWPVLVLAGETYVDPTTLGQAAYNPGDNYVEWYYGCGPTAGGSLFSYWDSRGHANAITAASVEEAIASDAHITSYYDIAGRSPDRGGPEVNFAGDPSPNAGAESPRVANNCIADYMGTSHWGAATAGTGGQMANGWSALTGGQTTFGGFEDVSSGLENYAAGQGDTVTVNKLFAASTLGWTNFTTEIDNARPVIFLVDTNADGSTDHFVPVFGYRGTPGVDAEYYAYNEWAATAAGGGAAWYTFAQMAAGVSWGVHSMTAMRWDAGVGSAGFTWVGGGDGWVGGGGGGGGSPEPSSVILLLLCLGGAEYARRRQSQKAA